MNMEKYFTIDILALCHAIILPCCSSYSQVYSSSGVKYINTNLSWFGPVLVTPEPGNGINFNWSITVPVEKCCPGLVVLQSASKEELIKMKKDCMDIEPKNLRFLYADSRTFIPLDYSYSDSKYKMCHAPDNTGIFRCNGYFYEMTQSPVYSAAFLFYPCQEKKGLEMKYQINFNLEKNFPYKCFQFSSIDSRSVCSTFYKAGYVPNLMGGVAVQDYLGIIQAMHILQQEIMCHKHLIEILCRMHVPECIAPGSYMSPCQSVVRNAIYACWEYFEISAKFDQFNNGPVDRDFYVNYISKMFPTEGLCFDVNVTCNEPPAIEHGTYLIETGHQAEYPVNTSVTYTCDENYNIDGESKAYCMYSGNWDSIPVCVLKSTGKLEVIITATTLGTFLFIVIVVVALVFKYRQELVVVMYAKYGLRFRTFKEEERKYDAFIAYNLEDISFVKNELLERLDPPYSICIHHKHFEIGDWISNNIIRAVAESKRTIIVLSQNFLNSQWCQFEFSQAHFQLIHDKSFKIIIIALEDPKTLQNIPKVVKSYTKTRTYIERDDKLFWQKLFYQMPSGHKVMKPGRII